jgi:hypothetical protein
MFPQLLVLPSPYFCSSPALFEGLIGFISLRGAELIALNHIKDVDGEEA